MRHAEYAILLTDSGKDFGRLLERVSTARNDVGFRMNVKKTKLMIVSKHKVNTQIMSGNVSIERVHRHQRAVLFLKGTAATKDIFS